ncbi:hypothetical protein VTL71DRAFT_12025 [Oculimacula yallundae]|uniref:Uncharacterized protein n=1 Tax=Oculimacula yallundae TaxID=86028 RepID=A0ABR4CSD4_9HELO
MGSGVDGHVFLFRIWESEENPCAAKGTRSSFSNIANIRLSCRVHTVGLFGFALGTNSARRSSSWPTHQHTFVVTKFLRE